MFSYKQALDYLDSHINYEVKPERVAPSLRRMQRLAHLLGDPQATYPIIHVTGTNGKGSTCRMISALVTSKGLSVGTYSSPHVEDIRERISYNLEPISESDMARVLYSVSLTEELMQEKLTFFEILTAAAFLFFADAAVEVGVIEVGMGGTWDTTNIADGQVAVITNVSEDHLEILGPTIEDVAREKVGIIKDISSVVLGSNDPLLVSMARGKASSSDLLIANEDFGFSANYGAYGGRYLDLWTPRANYPKVLLSLHGVYQGENAATAVAAVETFFDSELSQQVVEDAFSQLSFKGRVEIIQRHPLVILDAAHNPAGIKALVQTVEEEFFISGKRIVIVGLLKGRDVSQIVEPLGGDFSQRIIVCEPSSPRALPGELLVQQFQKVAKETLLASSVDNAIELAMSMASEEDLILITGSFYLIGTARSILSKQNQ